MASEDISSAPALLVTGGAGFIGSNFVRHALGVSSFEGEASGVPSTLSDLRVINLDALTYAGNPATVVALEKHPRYAFAHGSITDAAFVNRIFAEKQRRRRGSLRRRKPRGPLHRPTGRLPGNQRHGHVPPARSGAPPLDEPARRAGRGVFAFCTSPRTRSTAR